MGSSEIKTKVVKEMTGIYISGVGLNAFEKEERELMDFIKINNFPNKPLLGIFYVDQSEVKKEQVKWGLLYETEREIKPYALKTLPRVFVAYATHIGPYSTYGDSFNRLFTWISKNNYIKSGPIREIYITPNQVSELQIPIARKSQTPK